MSNAIAKANAISAKKNKHVQLLTLGRDMKCPRTGEVLFRNGREIREAQFYLRRAWAHTLLHIMKREIGIPWSQIQDFSGRTRQSWINVTNAMYLSPEQALDREQFGSFRPVTNNFIKRVTETLEADDRRFRLYTENFVDAWLLGLETNWNNGHQQRFTRERLGSPERVWGDFPDGQPHPIPAHFDAKWTEFSEWCQMELSEDTMFAIKSEVEGNPKLVDCFPLLEVNDDRDGQMFAWEYMIDLERTVFGDPDPDTGKPDERAVLNFNMWLHTSEHSPEEEEWKMADVERWKQEEKEYTKEQIQDMAQLDILDQYQAHVMILELERKELQEHMDASQERDDDEWETQIQETHEGYDNRPSYDEITGKKTKDSQSSSHFLLPQESVKPTNLTDVQSVKPVSLTFDIDPKFLSENLNGKVEFRVAIKYKQGLKVGHSIEVKGWTQSDQD